MKTNKNIDVNSLYANCLEPSDTEMIDFIEQLMTNDNDYCEVYLTGLRNWTGKATGYQFETNPDKIPILNKPTLREVIAEAMRLLNSREQ